MNFVTYLEECERCKLSMIYFNMHIQCIYYNLDEDLYIYIYI